MNEVYFEKIAAYLGNEMSAEERSAFESDLRSDEELASAFKIYSRTETEMRNQEQHRDEEIALKNTLAQLGKTHFKKETAEPAKVIAFGARKSYRLIASIAAIFILFVVGYLVLSGSKQTPQQLAHEHTQQMFTDLSQGMDASHDSMQLGLEALKKREYEKALGLFKGVYQSDTSKNDALKYTGIVYLVKNDFDSALVHFNKLSEKKYLFSNPGKLYAASALLQRNKVGDREQAKQLLQQVVDENAEGSEKAREWLKSF